MPPFPENSPCDDPPFASRRTNIRACQHFVAPTNPPRELSTPLCERNATQTKSTRDHFHNTNPPGLDPPGQGFNGPPVGRQQAKVPPSPLTQGWASGSKKKSTKPTFSPLNLIRADYRRGTQSNQFLLSLKKYPDYATRQPPLASRTLTPTIRDLPTPTVNHKPRARQSAETLATLPTAQTHAAPGAHSRDSKPARTTIFFQPSGRSNDPPPHPERPKSGFVPPGAGGGVNSQDFLDNSFPKSP